MGVGGSCECQRGETAETEPEMVPDPSLCEEAAHGEASAFRTGPRSSHSRRHRSPARSRTAPAPVPNSNQAGSGVCSVVEASVRQMIVTTTTRRGLLLSDLWFAASSRELKQLLHQAMSAAAAVSRQIREGHRPDSSPALTDPLGLTSGVGSVELALAE